MSIHNVGLRIIVLLSSGLTLNEGADHGRHHLLLLLLLLVLQHCILGVLRMHPCHLLRHCSLLLHLHLLLLMMLHMKSKIPRHHNSNIGPSPPSSNIRLKQQKSGIHKLLFFFGAVHSEEDEAEGHDAMELLAEEGGRVGWDVFTKEEDEVLDCVSFALFGVAT